MTINATNTPSPLTVSKGGTGASTLSQYSVLVGNGTGIVTQLASNGNDLLCGQASADPVFSTTADIYLANIQINGGTNLASYSQGTFNPTLTSSGTAPTVGYNYQIGRYTRIGNRVIISVNLSLSSISGGTGNTRIGALPFTVNSSSTNNIGSVVLQNTTLVASSYYTLDTFGYNTQLNFANMKSATPFIDLPLSSITSTTIISASLIYEV